MVELSPNPNVFKTHNKAWSKDSKACLGSTAAKTRRKFSLSQISMQQKQQLKHMLPSDHLSEHFF